MTGSSTVIIDSGGANLASLRYALTRLGVASVVSNDATTLLSARRIFLPGVGSAPDAMARLQASGVAALLPRLSQPLLGICLGMQLLFDWSEEGNSPCLGLLSGQVIRLPAAAERPIPHMGWNTLEGLCNEPLLGGITGQDYFYFVHSYAARGSAHCLARCHYGIPFAAVVRHNNFSGVQFHPERSGAAGARLLANFLELS